MGQTTLGLITPRTNSVNRREWEKLLPATVALATVGMDLHLDTETKEGRARLDRDLDAAMDALRAEAADVFVYACTAGSMVVPADDLPAAMSLRAGAPCVTTAAAIVAALRALDARRVAVATPYHDALNAHEKHFLEAHGFEVVAIAGLGIGAGGAHEFVEIARTPAERVAAHVTEVAATASDAVLISCTDFPTLDLIDGLEARLQRPVISSNTATLWAALGAIGPRPALSGGGRLLAKV